MKTVFFLIKRKVRSHFVHIGSPRDFVRCIGHLNQSRSSSSVLMVNGPILQEASTDAQLSNALDNADILIPNGKALLRGLRWLYKADMGRITPWVLMQEMLKDFPAESFSFYGHEKSKSVIELKYPGFNLNNLSLEDIGDSSEKRILIVCLPPKDQILWINDMKPRSSGYCMVGLGELHYNEWFIRRYAKNLVFSYRIFLDKLIYA